MDTQTQKFNAKMSEILARAKSGARICRETGEKFLIRQEDLDFYKKMLVPLPILAPWARSRQRYGYSFSSELTKTKSALSGKEILANTDPECPMKIYANDEWWSDAWDPTNYGIDYDSSKSFFEQLYNLKLQVPRPAKVQSGTGENSEWGIGGVNLKNCYMYYGGVDNENILYSVGSIKTRDSMEVFTVEECELCYEIFGSKRCYQCRYLENSEDCIDCSFGFGLNNCERCFGCVNLRYKKYYFFNEQLTKEEYVEKLKNINLGSRKEVDEWTKKFETFREQRAIQPNVRLKNMENSMGDDLVNCKNCYMCFNLFNAQDCAYCFFCADIRDVYDADGSLNAEYSISVVGKNLYNVKYCGDLVLNGRNAEYCELCYNIENCFGCVGLRNKKFHILNKEYNEKEYWQLIDKIKCDMLDRGEYGECMPMKYAFCPYNDTLANYFYPLTDEEAQKLGVRISKKNTFELTQGMNAETLPDDIAAANSDIIGKILICAKTKQPFKIVKEEFEFYKKMNIPLPTISYKVRRARQYRKWQAPKFIKGACAYCGKEIDIRGESLEKQRVKIVCNECYLKNAR